MLWPSVLNGPLKMTSLERNDKDLLGLYNEGTIKIERSFFDR